MIHDTNPVPIMLTDAELADHVNGIIANMNVGDEISFKQICSQIIRMAKEEGIVKPDTEFSSSEISPADQERVSAIMWDLLLDKKVYTIFGSYRWFGRSDEDTLFVVK